MERVHPPDRVAGSLVGPAPEILAYAAIAVVGALLFWISTVYPSDAPAWMPWEFSAPEYLAAALALLWFCRGLVLSPVEALPGAWRRLAFFLGLALTYGVLQTHFEYWAQHMFFLNRIQHVAMHHFGPFLMALGWPGAMLKRGMPKTLRTMLESPIIGAAMRLVQQPVLAAVLFVGLFALWLVPSIHFHAMLDGRLYALMNWSMVIDGVLFWSLVLDPRPKPPARASYGVRAALSIGVMFPQIVIGAVIGFSGRDLYPYYDLCGRILPSIGALTDQHIGGIIIWIPPAMMSVVGLLLVLNAMRRHQESIEETNENAAALAVMARRWTGN